MMFQRVTACVLVLLSITSSALSQAGDKQHRLQEDDEKLLRSLLKELVFAPPMDAKRVKVRVKEPGWWDKSEEQTRDGWLVRDNLGNRVYSTDGQWVPAPAKEKIEEIDYLAKSGPTH